jgi:hypothetical protein
MFASLSTSETQGRQCCLPINRGMRLVAGVLGVLGLLLGAVFMLAGALLFGFLLFALGGAGVRYGLIKPSRTCPRCGKRVRVGKLDCGPCGFDFRQIGQTQTPA